jgi:hypothetical protein
MLQVARKSIGWKCCIPMEILCECVFDSVEGLEAQRHMFNGIEQVHFISKVRYRPMWMLHGHGDIIIQMMP